MVSAATDIVNISGLCGKTLHNFLDIWKEENPRIPELPWRAQMADYTAQFPTEEAAQKYVDGVRKYRAQEQLRQQQAR